MDDCGKMDAKESPLHILLTSKIFTTKDDLVKFALKEDILSFKDAILHEIVAMRQELSIVIGYRDQIEDHKVRLEKVEKKVQVR